jgi:BirA family biotin operon repressor/biotin-[acetyl-CoA-carboxylase] ligase
VSVAAEVRWEGETASALASRLGLPEVVLLDEVSSTLDVAHERAAEGAVAGTLVLADRQTAGRGRAGRRWTSEPGAGIWLTLVERPASAAHLGALPLRLGMAAARALDPFAAAPVQLKWPNDLQVAGRKLAGILLEARWRDGQPDWIAVGMGVNVRAPADVPDATGLARAPSRLEPLAALVPALRTAASVEGPLTTAELAEYASRDAARGRRCVEPLRGTVQGVAPGGELMIDTGGATALARAGSLRFVEDDA